MAEAEQRRSGLPIGRVLAAAVGIAALAVVGRQAGTHAVEFADWVRTLGVWGPVVFITGYAVAVVAFVPASLLTFAAGWVFGLTLGVVYVFAAAVIGSSLAFLVSRYVARGAIERRLAGNPRFAAIDRAVGAEGRRIVFLLRLSPVFPFGLLNYGLGLTRVRLVDYLVASVGMIPGTVLYVYSGAVAKDLVALAAGGGVVARGAGYYGVIVLGIVATAAVTVRVTQIARRALREATGE